MGGTCTGFLWGSLTKGDRWGGPRCIWEDNIKVDLQEVGCGRRDCTELAKDTDRWQVLVNKVMNLRVS